MLDPKIDAYKIITRYMIERLRRYRADADRRGDRTQEHMIQEDREFIARILNEANLMEDIFGQDDETTKARLSSSCSVAPRPTERPSRARPTRG